MKRFKKEICLGMAVDQHLFWVAVLDANDPESPWPLELRSFSNTGDLKDYWFSSRFREYKVVLAAFDNQGDDHGVLDWLTAEFNVKSEEFTNPLYVLYSQTKKYKVPDHFQKAYALALGCVFRNCAVDLTDMALAEAFELEVKLRALTAQLEYLKATLPYETSPL